MNILRIAVLSVVTVMGTVFNSEAQCSTGTATQTSYANSGKCGGSNPSEQVMDLKTFEVSAVTSSTRGKQCVHERSFR